VVDKLGTFIEVEAIDNTGKFTVEELKEQCDYYYRFFDLAPAQLIQQSYSDMIINL